MVGKEGTRFFIPIVVFFLLSSLFFWLGEKLLAGWNISASVLLIGNLILFAATTVSFYFYYRSLQNNAVHYFLKMIYGGMFIKMIICLLSSFIYIFTAGSEVNKGGIIGCMGLYLVYTVMEVMQLMKISKRRKNA